MAGVSYFAYYKEGLHYIERMVLPDNDLSDFILFLQIFGPGCYEAQADGRLLLIQGYSDINDLTMWMLTFGDKVEVIEPTEVREKLKNIAESMIRKYGRKKSGRN